MEFANFRDAERRGLAQFPSTLMFHDTDTPESWLDRFNKSIERGEFTPFSYSKLRRTCPELDQFTPIPSVASSVAPHSNSGGVLIDRFALKKTYIQFKSLGGFYSSPEDFECYMLKIHNSAYPHRLYENCTTFGDVMRFWIDNMSYMEYDEPPFAHGLMLGWEMIKHTGDQWAHHYIEKVNRAYGGLNNVDFPVPEKLGNWKTTDVAELRERRYRMYKISALPGKQQERAFKDEMRNNEKFANFIRRVSHRAAICKRLQEVYKFKYDAVGLAKWIPYVCWMFATQEAHVAYKLGVHSPSKPPAGLTKFDNYGYRSRTENSPIHPPLLTVDTVTQRVKEVPFFGHNLDSMTTARWRLNEVYMTTYSRMPVWELNGDMRREIEMDIMINNKFDDPRVPFLFRDVVPTSSEEYDCDVTPTDDDETPAPEQIDRQMEAELPPSLWNKFTGMLKSLKPTFMTKTELAADKVARIDVDKINEGIGKISEMIANTEPSQVDDAIMYLTSQEFKDSVRKVGEAAEKLNGDTLWDSVVDSVCSGLKKSLFKKSYMATFKETLDRIDFGRILMAYIFYTRCPPGDSIGQAAAIFYGITGVRELSFLQTVVAGLTVWCGHYYMTRGQVIPTSDESGLGWVWSCIKSIGLKTGIIATILICIAGFFGLTLNESQRAATWNAARSIREIGFVAQAGNHFITLGRNISSMYDVVASWLYEMWTGKKFDSIDDQALTQALELEQTAAQICGDDLRTVLINSQSMRDEADQVLTQMLTLRNDFWTRSDPRYTRPTHSLNLAIHKLQERLAAARNEANKRPTSRPIPFVICLVGCSGCGKSVIADRIARSFARRLKTSVYPRNPTSAYWDGYTGQKVILMDDFNSIDNQTEADLLQLVGSVPHYVVCADLADKGTPFQGEVIIMTTNNANFRGTGVYHPQAIDRRRHLFIEVQPSPDVVKVKEGKSIVSASRLAQFKKMQVEAWMTDISRGTPIDGFDPRDVDSEDLNDMRKALMVHANHTYPWQKFQVSDPIQTKEKSEPAAWLSEDFKTRTGFNPSNPFEYDKLIPLCDASFTAFRSETEEQTGISVTIQYDKLTKAYQDRLMAYKGKNLGVMQPVFNIMLKSMELSHQERVITDDYREGTGAWLHDFKQLNKMWENEKQDAYSEEAYVKPMVIGTDDSDDDEPIMTPIHDPQESQPEPPQPIPSTSAQPPPAYESSVTTHAESVSEVDGWTKCEVVYHGVAYRVWKGARSTVGRPTDTQLPEAPWVNTRDLMRVVVPKSVLRGIGMSVTGNDERDFDMDLEFVRHSSIYKNASGNTRVMWHGVGPMDLKHVQNTIWFRTSYSAVLTFKYELAEQIWSYVENDPCFSAIVDGKMQRIFRSIYSKYQEMKRNIVSPFWHLWYTSDIFREIMHLMAVLVAMSAFILTLSAIGELLCPPYVQESAGIYSSRHGGKKSDARQARMGVNVIGTDAVATTGRVSHNPMSLLSYAHIVDFSSADKFYEPRTEVVTNRIKMNTRCLRVARAPDSDLSIHFIGTFICGNAMLIPRHSLQRVIDAEWVEVCNSQGFWERYSVVPERDTWESPDTDLALIVLRNHAALKSLTRYIPPTLTSAMADAGQHGLEIVEPTKPISSDHGPGFSYHYFDPQQNPLMTSQEFRVQDREVKDSFFFRMPWKKGGSGSPVMLRNRVWEQAPLIGMMNFMFDAGVRYAGFTALRKDILEEALADLKVIQWVPSKRDLPGNVTATALSPDTVTDVNEHNGYHVPVFLKVENAKHFAPSSTKNDYIPSVIYDDIVDIHPSGKQPAIVSPFDGRWPEVAAEHGLTHHLQISASKNVKGNVPQVEQDELDLCYKRVGEHIQQELRTGYSPCKVWDDITAITGENGARIDPHTSAGFPWQHEYPNEKGKDMCFKLDDKGKVIWINPLFKQRAGELLALLRKGQMPPTVNKIFPKGELRAKLEKTRSIAVVAADVTLVARKLFGNFSERFNNFGRNTPFAVGINPTSIEWQQLYLALYSKSCGKACWDCDVANWDGTVTVQDALAFARVVNMQYGCEYECECPDCTARTTLCMLLISSPWQIDNYVYQTERGNPSGSPLTTLKNTIVHMARTYGMYRWVLTKFMTGEWRPNPTLVELIQRMGITVPTLKQLRRYKSYSEFRRLVCYFVYGDDKIVSVDLVLLPYYNALTEALAYQACGRSVTTASKGEATVAYKDIDDIQFLKRFFKFCKDTGRMAAPLDKVVLYDMARYTRAGDGYAAIDQLYLTINSGLREAVQHGKKFFDIYQGHLSTALIKRGFPSHHQSYMDYVHDLSDDYRDVEAWTQDEHKGPAGKN